VYFGPSAAKFFVEIDMEQDNSGQQIERGVSHRVGESSSEYRERMALIQAQAIERRQQELHEQSSPLNSASDRIRIWERVHQVKLPRNPAHRLIAVIAANTGLSADEVRAEQQQRLVAAAPPVTSL
jgi:hypothetical protein